MTSTVFCGACGTELNADAKFCASCGERQEPFEPTVPSAAADPVPSGRTALAIGALGLVGILALVVLFGRPLPLTLGIVPVAAIAAIAFGLLRATRPGSTMGREVHISAASSGKVRSFWMGFTLSLLTLGIYALFWYYFVNEELKDVGSAKRDDSLAQSSPTHSVVAISIGGWLIFPPFLSLYNYGQRIKRAQRLGGVPQEQQINPTVAFLLYFPGLFLIVPYFVFFWYVTKHQNAALLANAQHAADGSPATAGAVA